MVSINPRNIYGEASASVLHDHRVRVDLAGRCIRYIFESSPHHNQQLGHMSPYVTAISVIDSFLSVARTAVLMNSQLAIELPTF